MQEDYKSIENMNMKQKEKISKLEADIKGKEVISLQSLTIRRKGSL